MFDAIIEINTRLFEPLRTPILLLYNQGYSPMQICEKLNGAGVRHPKGLPQWSLIEVKKALSMLLRGAGPQQHYRPARAQTSAYAPGAESIKRPIIEPIGVHAYDDKF